MTSLRPVSGTAEEILALLREWEAAEDPRPLVIATSGSTGEPKRVVLSRSAMRASADATHTRLGGPGQWVLNLPPTYVAGLQVLFRCVRAGTEPVVAQPEEFLADVAARMEGPRRYVSLVATQLQRLVVGRGAEAALAGFDAVLIGGGPLDPRLRTSAGAVPLVATYGMSETCGGCVYDGLPLDGVRVRIDSPGPDGIGAVQLRGPMLFDGYEAEPERTRAAYDGGWLRTHDLGRIADGVLEVVGREDDVIISGGVKVPAQAVASMLSADPAVVDSVVVGVPDREWGERVVAVVEPHDPLTLEDLRDLVTPRAWAPRQLVLVPSIPRLSNGKPDRVACRELARG